MKTTTTTNPTTTKPTAHPDTITVPLSRNDQARAKAAAKRADMPLRVLYQAAIAHVVDGLESGTILIQGPADTTDTPPKPATITAQTAIASPFTISEEWVSVEIAIDQELANSFAEMTPARAEYIARMIIEECRETAMHGAEDWFIKSIARNEVPDGPTPFVLKLRAWEWAWIEEQAKELAVAPATWLRIELWNSFERAERERRRMRGRKTA